MKAKLKIKYPLHDFFAGSGLVSLAFDGCFNTVWANDNCPKKAHIFCSNLNRSVFVNKSIENVSGSSMPRATVSWASFPCQDLSLAGKLKGLEGSRSGLIWEWFRVIKEMANRPPILVAENVTGLISIDDGIHYVQIHKELEKLGYNVGAIILDAKHWIPQSRKRIFIIAIDNKIDINDFIDDNPSWAHPKILITVANKLKKFVWWKIKPPNKRVTELIDIIDLNIDFDKKKSEDYVKLIPHKHILQIKKCYVEGKNIFTGYKRVRDGQQRLEVRFDGLSGCLRTAKGGSSKQFIIFVNNNKIFCRYMTPREAARLMGAPETFVLPINVNDAYSAMGDAVVVPVTKYLAENLIRPIAEKCNKICKNLRRLKITRRTINIKTKGKYYEQYNL